MTSRRQEKKRADLNRILLREEERKKASSIRKILKKSLHERTADELNVIAQFPDLVTIIKSRIEKQVCLKIRLKEVEDSHDVLVVKCEQLAEALASAKGVVVYTGAGISTAAQIPDYRGPDGVWTCLEKGKQIRAHDITLALPTFTHMALAHLYKQGIVKHVVSQNCDGLHRRSGIPARALSELHGNMYIEVCSHCKPMVQYIRPFDVTQNTNIHRHQTGRKCAHCKSELKDTIVHFGERGKLRWPLNWEGAFAAVKACDTVLCLGSSLKVIKHYKRLWKPSQKLYVVNLQWTPKDYSAKLKINGRCDEVMATVMEHLELKVSGYSKGEDPFFKKAVPDKSWDDTIHSEPGWYGKGLTFKKRKLLPKKEEEEE